MDKFPSTTDWPGKSRLTSPVSFGILSEEAKVSAPKQPTSSSYDPVAVEAASAQLDDPTPTGLIRLIASNF